MCTKAQTTQRLHNKIHIAGHSTKALGRNHWEKDPQVRQCTVCTKNQAHLYLYAWLLQELPQSSQSLSQPPASPLLVLSVEVSPYQIFFSTKELKEAHSAKEKQRQCFKEALIMHLEIIWASAAEHYSIRIKLRLISANNTLPVSAPLHCI